MKLRVKIEEMAKTQAEVGVAEGPKASKKRKVDAVELSSTASKESTAGGVNKELELVVMYLDITPSDGITSCTQHCKPVDVESSWWSSVSVPVQKLETLLATTFTGVWCKVPKGSTNRTIVLWCFGLMYGCLIAIDLIPQTVLAVDGS